MSKHLIILLILVSSLASAADIGLSPARLELSGEPGQTLTETITILTDTVAEQQVQVEVSDFTISPEGELGTLPAGSLEESAAPWIQPEVSDFILAGAEGREFNISLTIPDDPNLEGTYHAMVFFTVIPPITDTSGIGVITTTQIGLTIYVNIAGTEDNTAELVDFYQDDPSTMSFAVANLGNTIMRLSGNIEMRDENGNAKYVIEIPDTPILRGSEREVTVNIPEEIEPGSYVALALIEDSRSGILVGELPIEVE
jgi:hypothetical protein